MLKNPGFVVTYKGTFQCRYKNSDLVYCIVAQDESCKICIMFCQNGCFHAQSGSLQCLIKLWNGAIFVNSMSLLQCFHVIKHN